MLPGREGVAAAVPAQGHASRPGSRSEAPSRMLHVPRARRGPESAGAVPIRAHRAGHQPPALEHGPSSAGTEVRRLGWLGTAALQDRQQDPITWSLLPAWCVVVAMRAERAWAGPVDRGAQARAGRHPTVWEGTCQSKAMISGIAFAPHSGVSRSLRKAAGSKAKTGRRVKPVSFSGGRPVGTGSCPTTEIDRTVAVDPP